MNHQARTQAVIQRLEEENGHWLLVSHLPNVRYLSGFTGSYATLVIGQEKRYILTDGRYSEQVRQEVTEYEPVIQGNRKEMQAIADILGNVSNKTLWFEAEHYSYMRYSSLCEMVASQACIGKRGVVEHLRAVKDEEEISAMREALRITEAAFEKALDFIHEGMTERELAHFLLDEMWRGGAVKESFDPLILFGARSSMCHGKSTYASLKKGDIVLMDFGCLMPDGYNSDLTRTVFFGKPDSEKKKMYQCVLDANLAAEERLRAGISGVEGDEFARSVFRQAGRLEQFVHGLGHGVGLEIHESPRLSPLSEHSLLPNHMVTVEPGVYIPNVGGVRIEDMVVIRENGCELLNRSNKKMIVL